MMGESMFKKALLSLVLVVVAGAAAAAPQTSIPPKFPISWGASAGAAYIRSIPQSSQIGVTNCAASLTDGFPPLTFVPQTAGGCPPFGADFNGILNQVSSWARWQAMGGQIPWDSSFSASIGGYPIGAVVPSLTTANLWWQSTADNNTSNPDSGGGNWSGVGYAPTGAIIAFGGAAAPPGYVLCTGQAISRATFGALFAVIGTNYGPGDGTTTFNVPDLRGRTVYGPDAGANRITSAGGNFNAVLGASGGQQNQTLTQAQLPPITPTWNPTTQTWSSANGNVVVTGGGTLIGSGAVGVSAIAITTTVTPNGSIGGFAGLLGQSHPVLSPGTIANYIIKY